MAIVPTGPGLVTPNPGAVGKIANPTFATSPGEVFSALLVGSLNTANAAKRARAAGVSGAAFHSNVVTNLIFNALSAVPGVNLLSAGAQLVGNLIGSEENLREFQRRELIENPDYLRGPPGPFRDSTILELQQRQNVRSIRAREAANTESAFLSERRAIAESQERERIQKALFSQRVPFSGIPSIFTRRARIN
jgi:hypothetical protein